MPETRQKLILFDIDGTLVRMRPGMPHEIFEHAMADLFEIEISLDGFDFSGKTDYLIFSEVGEIAGLSSEVIEANQECVMHYVAQALQDSMNAESLQLLPGVLPLLESLGQREKTMLAILTGNTPRGAEVKLGVHDLNRFFQFGVYGNETHDRNELGPLAIKRASTLLEGRRISGKDVIVIGDTMRDAACAEAIGAKCIITLTGKTTREEFAGYEPEHIFENLLDLDAVNAAIFGEVLV